MSVKYIIMVTLLAFLAGCGSEEENIDTELAGIISYNGLSGDPSVGRSIPSIADAKAQLGMKLFFTKSLGGNLDSACVTCHHPVLGGGDNLSLSIGVEAVNHDILGEGRSPDSGAVNYENGYAPVPRNAPSTFNVALWDRGLYWDYRVESITPNAGHNGEVGGIRTPDSAFGVADASAGANLTVAQARFPVTSFEEMRGFSFESGNNDAVRAHLALRLKDPGALDYITNTWDAEFTPIYGTGQVNFENIVDAIGAYERSQLFVNTPWKSCVGGDRDAISGEAKRGAKLFFESYENGGMNCVACHSGDFFTDESFHVMAVPQVGRGKESISGDDFGRMRVTSDAADRYAFRTPTLLNVEVTGPWGHDGVYTSLRAMVAHMINPDAAVAGYDYSQLDANVKTDFTEVNTAAAVAQLHANRTAGISPHQNVTATDAQIDEIVAFLKTLTDPCVKDRSCIGQWIPANVQGPDSLQLNAEDASGNLL